MSKLILSLNGKDVSLPSSLRAHEPTHVSRYWIIARILPQLHAPTGKILDVGGRKGLLKNFGFKPTIIDIEASNENNYIQGDALNMPFGDKQFGVSVSCDVLEHINASDREQFLSEIIRVSESAILCAPFNNPGVSEAEIEINSYAKSLLRKGHHWLQEHIDNGLPSETEVEVIIKGLGYHYVKFRHFSLEAWPIVIKTHLLEAALGDSKSLVKAARRVYGAYYDDVCEYDFSDAGYRTFYVIAREPISLTLPSKEIVAAKSAGFLNSAIAAYIETIKKQALQIRQLTHQSGHFNSQLSEATRLAEKQREEIRVITSSKRWKLAQKMAEIKRFGK